MVEKLSNLLILFVLLSDGKATKCGFVILPEDYNVQFNSSLKVKYN